MMDLGLRRVEACKIEVDKQTRLKGPKRINWTSANSTRV